MPYAEYFANDAEGQLRLPLEYSADNKHVTLLPPSISPRHGYVSGVLPEKNNSSSVVRLPVSGRRNSGVNGAGAGPQLTARERQVLDLLVRGLSSKCIAHELVISPRTVEVHRANLMRKMGVRNIAALVRTVFEAA
jgi:DNA-binding CsgD family transcriptional regulator